MCAHLGFIAHCVGYLLIIAVGYGVENWDAMVGVAKLCNWHCCSRLC